MRRLFPSLILTLLLCLIVSCTGDNPFNKKDDTIYKGEFVPVKTYKAGRRVTSPSFDELGRLTSFTIIEQIPEGDFHIADNYTFEAVYSEDGSFEAELNRDRIEGSYSGRRVQRAKYFEWNNPNPMIIKAVYDGDDNISSLVRQYGNDSIDISFKWSAGNISEYDYNYTGVDTSEPGMYPGRVIVEYGQVDNVSGLGAFMVYPEEYNGNQFFYGYFFGTAFTTKVPIRVKTYDTGGELIYTVEYADIKTDSKGLVTSFVKKYHYEDKSRADEDYSVVYTLSY